MVTKQYRTAVNEAGLQFYNTRDVKDFEKLYTLYKPFLMNSFLKSFTHSVQDANSMVDESMLRIYKYIDKYNSKHAFYNWFYTISKYAALAWLNKKSITTKGLIYTDDMSRNHDFFEDEIDEVHSKYLPLINKLLNASEYGDLIRDRIINEMSYQEIGKKYNMLPEEVANHIGKYMFFMRIMLNTHLDANIQFKKYRPKLAKSNCVSKAKKQDKFCYVHTDFAVMRILRTELEKYVDWGWKTGRRRSGEKLVINLDEDEKTIKSINKSIKETDEFKNKKSVSNSFSGTHWIHNDVESIRVPQYDIDFYKSKGYTLGRVIYFTTKNK
jgi:RNA polymerase sigma factor (sigma-70 family)